MDISFLTEYLSPVIFGICLCVGFVVKNFIPTDKVNKYIPVIVCVLGLFLGIWVNDWTVTPVIVLNGFLSGLASTGFYELFANFIKRD